MKYRLPDLIGVIACGGTSSRMGTDKCHLNYHGKPQCYYLYDLLLPFCSDVFISCSDIQSSTFSAGYKIIVDKTEFKDHGPVSGLLSSFSENPTCSILYVGCDYPFVDEITIRNLLSRRMNKFPAIAYANDEKIFEPLITLYENFCFKEILKQFNEKNYSLRHFLDCTKTFSILPENNKTIKSIDTLAEYQETILNFSQAN